MRLTLFDHLADLQYYVRKLGHSSLSNVSNVSRKGNTMKRLVEFSLEGGGTVLVEVDALEEPGPIPAARGEVVQRAHKTFEEALEVVRPMAQVILDKLHALHDPPDEVQVEFGLKMSAEAGALIAAASAEANYRVTLTWKREE